MAFPAHNVFDLDSARRAARDHRVHEWVQHYLRSGTWQNLGLADGLLLAPRWWLGPFQAPIDSFSRKCGPEARMEYQVPLDAWKASVASMAASINSVEDVPPLIVEGRAGRWFIADGNHRHEAFLQRGFETCWAFGWLNSEADLQRASSVA